MNGETLKERFDRNKGIIDRVSDPTERAARLGSALDFFNLVSRATEAGDDQLIGEVRRYLSTKLTETLKEKNQQ